MDIVKSPKANIIIDASQLDLFELCEARFNYRYNLHKTLPLIQKSRSLGLGSLAHEGFEVYYKSLAAGTHFNESVEAATLSMRVKAADANESNSTVDESEVLIRVVQENLDYWRHEDESFEILSVESPFAYVLFEDDHVRIIISGKIDLLVNKPAIGGSSGYSSLPIDHKTYSRDSIVGRLSNQFINYASAVGSSYLIVNRVGLQKSLKAEEKFKRLPLSYDPLIIQQWKDNTITIILEKYVNCVASKTWPMNFTSCLKFNRLCEYHDVCDSSGQDAKDFKLENNYVDTEPWDVTKGMGE